MGVFDLLVGKAGEELFGSLVGWVFEYLVWIALL